MVAGEVSADQLPLLKILFHAAKYPHAGVNGILLGSAGAGGAVTVTDAIPLFHNSLELAGPTEIALGQVRNSCTHAGCLGDSPCSHDTSVLCMVAVPKLLHGTLMPLHDPCSMHITCAQVETYTKESGRPQVVGYYHCDARFQASDISPIGRRLADRIAQRHPSAVVLLLDNKKLSAFLQEGGESPAGPFELFRQEGSTWRRETPGKLTVSSNKAVREKFLSAFQQQSYRQLHDFDEHLDDLSKDFLNPQLATLVESR